jgi:LPXTG-motif cell wall-anchored protein
LLRTSNTAATGLNAHFTTQGTGSWTMTSLNTNGTVEYYAGGSQTITERTYNNLTISGTGTKTLTRSANGTINGSVAINGGTFAMPGNYTTNIGGDWARASGAAFTAPTNGTIVFNKAGTANLSIGTAGGTETFCKLTINSGTTLDTGDDFVAVSGTAGCTTLTTTGVLRHTTPSTAVANGVTVNFPTGRNLTGVQISGSTGGLGNVTVLTELSQINFQCNATTLGGTPIRRLFNITPTNTTGVSATLRLYYDTNEGNPATVNIFHCDTATSTWTRLTTGTYSTGSDANGSFVQLTGVTTFSPFAIGGGPGNPTAVTLSSFDAQTDASTNNILFLGLGIGAITLLSGGWYLARRKAN